MDWLSKVKNKEVIPASLATTKQNSSRTADYIVFQREWNFTK